MPLFIFGVAMGGLLIAAGWVSNGAQALYCVGPYLVFIVVGLAGMRKKAPRQVGQHGGYYARRTAATPVDGVEVVIYTEEVTRELAYGDVIVPERAARAELGQEQVVIDVLPVEYKLAGGYPELVERN